jgi:hypothetical protein
MHTLIGALARYLGFNPLGWLLDTRRMRELVGAFQQNRKIDKKAVHFAVVVMPWMGTGVPWFSLVCGLFLADRGNKVTFIVDDMPFGANGFRSRCIVGCIDSVLKLLRGQHEVIHLGEKVTSSPLDERAQKSIERLATLNAVWELRGEMVQDGRSQYTARTVGQFGEAYGAIANVLSANHFDVLFVPGGMWGTTGIWSERARAEGMRLATYDGGNGTIMLCVNGVASQLQDIPTAYSLLKDHANSHGSHAFIVESALAEMGRRRSGVDKFASQIKGHRNVDARFKDAVLVALNSSWDSAALGLHAVYEDSAQWIVETAKYLLDNTSAQVIIRQHPAERLKAGRSSDDYSGLLSRHLGSNPRLHFIAAEDPVNSYDLLEQVAVVVVYTSTFGIEAVANGKPVITPSNSYYSDLGFVRKATSLAQYHQYLSDAVSGQYAVTQTMRDDAMCCFYLTQCCNWVFSPFNPEGFPEWGRYDLDKLSQLDKVQMTIHALEQNVPIAFLHHRSRLADQSSQGRS